MSRLDGDVAVSGPVARERVTIILRATSAMRKDNHGILSGTVRIKNADVQVFVALRIVQDEVGDFGGRVRSGRQLVSAGVFRS